MESINSFIKNLNNINYIKDPIEIYYTKLLYYTSQRNLTKIALEDFKYALPILNPSQVPLVIYLNHTSNEKVLNIIQEVIDLSDKFGNLCSNCNLVNLRLNKTNFDKYGKKADKIYNQEIISQNSLSNTLELNTIYKSIKKSKIIMDKDTFSLGFSNSTCARCNSNLNKENLFIFDFGKIQKELNCKEILDLDINSNLLLSELEPSLSLQFLIKLSNLIDTSSIFIFEYPIEINFSTSNHKIIQIVSNQTLNIKKKIIDNLKVKDEIINFYLKLNQSKELGLNKKNLDKSDINYKGIQYNQLEKTTIKDALNIFSHLKHTQEYLSKISNKELFLGSPIALC